jgi:triacylglycerol lipase
VVIPYTSAFLSGANTTNVLLQSRCPLALIRNALGRPGPADPGYRPSCLPV